MTLRAAVVAGTGVVMMATLTASPTLADPDSSLTLAEAQRRVEKLNHEAEQANERYLELAHEVDTAKKRIKKLKSDVAAQQTEVRKVRGEVAGLIADRLTSAPMGPTAQLLASDDADEFLEGLTVMQSYNATQSERLDAFESETAQLKSRKRLLSTKLAVISDAEGEMDEQQDTLDDKIAEAEALVDELTPVQRTQVYNTDNGTSRSSDRPSAPSVDASGRAKTAIDFALAQLGDPYVYGAAGPDSYDCSGLTMAAYAAAGVSLPHSSAAQSGMGASVSTSSMSPGDLVFYYSPVSHVGIYLGDGQLVHAPNSGSSVEVVPVDLMPITAVRRVG